MRVSMFGRPVLLAMVLAVCTSACASGGGSGSSTRSSSTLLVEEDLAGVANLSAYEAVQRLRPLWLQVRSVGVGPVIFVNGTQVGSAETLRNYRAGDLSEIRYRRGSDATTRYGTGFGGGTIELRTKG